MPSRPGRYTKGGPKAGDWDRDLTEKTGRVVVRRGQLGWLVVREDYDVKTGEYVPTLLSVHVNEAKADEAARKIVMAEKEA